MDSRGLLIVLAVVLAGCAEAPGPVEEPEALDAAPQPDSNVTAMPAVPVDVTVDVVDLTNRTSLHWATDAKLGDTAFEVVIDVGAENECDVTSTVAGRAGEAGVRSVFLVESGSRYAWTAGGGGGLATAYAGPVDTRSVLGESGQYGSGSAVSGTFDGVVNLTRVAKAVEPWDNSISGNKSLSLDVECAKPFDVLGARVGHQVLLASAESMGGGVGADVFLAGNAMVQATASVDVTTRTGHAVMGHFGAEAGRVEVEHPDGTTLWLPGLTSTSLERLQDGPGTYTFTVDRVGAYFEAFWLAAFGFVAEVDLVAGLQDEPTYESPF